MRAAVILSTFSVALFFASSLVWADNADDLVLVLHYDAYYANIAQISVGLALQRLKENGLSPSSIESINSKLKSKSQDYKQNFLRQIAVIYRRKFNAQELTDLITFYKSPLGQKIGNAQKSIQDELASATRDVGVYIGVAAAQLAEGAQGSQTPSQTSNANANGQNGTENQTTRAPTGQSSSQTSNANGNGQSGSEQQATHAQTGTGRQFTLYENRDLVGSALSTVAAADPEACKSACVANSACIAFTENIWNQKCFLKNQITAMRLEPAAISGVLKDHPPPALAPGAPTINRYKGRILSGVSYRTLTNVEYDGCEKGCSADNSCVAFSFVESSHGLLRPNQTSGVCQLFKKVSASHTDQSAESGVKRQTAP